MKLSLSSGIILLAIIIFGFSDVAYAATLDINISKDTFLVGDQFNADVKIDSEDVGVNAAQATIKFSPAILQVVSVDKTSSVFNFWIQDPEFNNDTGEISFIGGASSGLIGKSLQVIRIVFKAKGLGQSDIIFTDGAVTASDGSGTNVLSVMNKNTVNISTTTSITKVQTIERTPIASSTSPAKPNVKVLLYPDPVKWYNISSKFSASWQLPSDISAVATELNKDPSFNPTKSGGIFDNEMFPALSDGTWYLHVRFYNNIGWSVTNHYRIAIDTVPPSPFEIKFSDGPSSDNPAPTVSYQANDQLSGIDHYYIQIDGKETINTDLSPYTLPLQGPGNHIVKIGGQDKAGNKVESVAEFKILPIESPKIISVTKDNFSGEGGLVISGESLPKAIIILEIKDQKNNLIYYFKTNSGEDGKWTMKIDSPLKNGNYYIEATAQDGRGATSLAVRSEEIRVKSKPIIQIGMFQLGAGEATLFLLFILVAGFVSGAWFYKKRQEKLAMRVEFAGSEITKIFKIITGDIDALCKSFETAVTSDDEYNLKRLRENIKKMESYLKKGVEKIKK
jgi:hypothetical protein